MKLKKYLCYIPLVLIIGLIFLTGILAANACPHEHLTEELIEPTCVDRGYTYTVCDDCEMVIRARSINPLGHQEESKQVKDPTCTNEGLIQFYCSRCGKVLREETIKANGHNWSEVQCLRKATALVDEVWGSYCYNCNEMTNVSIRSRYDIVQAYKQADPNFYGLISFSFNSEFSVPLYTSESKYWQTVVDRWNSALFIPGSQLRGANVYADHNYQGFSIIRNSYIGSKAYILKPDGSLETITCFEIIYNGINNGAICLDDGTRIEDLYENFSYAYTCNDDPSRITIVLYR